ncbi:hypothetical protein B0H13DRAFT_2238321 [Mycena leptocephala]|nr:hypothetical protein B0H13DRAFT_2238321 [Mycena leptocephala]
MPVSRPFTPSTPPSHPRLPSYTPVAIFVVGTSGIGQGMAEAFARHTKAMRILSSSGATAPLPIPSSRPSGPHEFIECDMTLMSNVHRVETELRARIPKINFLMLTPGLAVHYYGRWHFVKNFLPAVEAAKEEGEDGKVMSIDLKDLGLKKGFSVASARAATPTYTDIMINDLAVRQPALTFIRAHPGIVTSNLYNSSSAPLIHLPHPVFTPFIYSAQSTGEHHLYAFLMAGSGAVRTGPKGDDIGLTKEYSGSKEAMGMLWAHTEEATKARRICS